MHEESEDQLDPDEPHTPAWLTFFGLGFFLLAGIFFLITSGGDDPQAADQSTDEVAALGNSARVGSGEEQADQDLPEGDPPEGASPKGASPEGEPSDDE